ncbi:MAG: hypothetical protein EAZ61_13605, partial [Oscillatoriales cyanobacterium]
MGNFAVLRSVVLCRRSGFPFPAPRLALRLKIYPVGFSGLMTTASTSHFDLTSPIVPMRWLNFARPADLLTFPIQALPIVMQSAVCDRQREMMHLMQEGMTSTTVATSGGLEGGVSLAETKASATDPTSATQYQRVAILVADPWECLVSAIAAHGLQCDVFLGDPSWSETERTAMFAQVQPAIMVHDRPHASALAQSLPSDPASLTDRPRDFSGPILQSGGVTLERTLHSPNRAIPPQPTPDRDPYWAIPTGGTSGRIRFACHTWQTLAAAAIGVREFFQSDRLNSFCCLPVFHVSGLAQVIRALISGGQLALAHPSILRCEQTPPSIPPDRNLQTFWLSLVPTQLQRLIDRPAWLPWLQQFNVIFLGGAPAWDELLIAARSQGLRLAPTFGMTETAAQIATLHPDDFLAGRTGCGRVLPHAHLSLVPAPDIVPAPISNPDSPRAQPSPNFGLITIRARSLFLGYYDAKLAAADPATAVMPWSSDDLGYFDADGSLHLVGRASQKVITGGEKVYPEEVEAVIRATGLVRDVAVIGLPDREWGQSLAAVYVPWDTPITEDVWNAGEPRSDRSTD